MPDMLLYKIQMKAFLMGCTMAVVISIAGEITEQGVGPTRSLCRGPESSQVGIDPDGHHRGLSAAMKNQSSIKKIIHLININI